MKKQYLEAGQIVSTHGVQGEVKILPWCDGPEFLQEFSQLFIDGTGYAVEHSRVHKNMLLCKLRGIDDMNAAQTLKNKVITIDRTAANIPEGRVFISDLIGLPVFADGQEIGQLKDVYTGPANDVYVVKGKSEYMIPAVSEFLQEVNVDEGFIQVKLIPGMDIHEN